MTDIMPPCAKQFEDSANQIVASVYNQHGATQATLDVVSMFDPSIQENALYYIRDLAPEEKKQDYYFFHYQARKSSFFISEKGQNFLMLPGVVDDLCEAKKVEGSVLTDEAFYAEFEGFLAKCTPSNSASLCEKFLAAYPHSDEKKTHYDLKSKQYYYVSHRDSQTHDALTHVENYAKALLDAQQLGCRNKPAVEKLLGNISDQNPVFAMTVAKIISGHELKDEYQSFLDKSIKTFEPKLKNKSPEGLKLILGESEMADVSPVTWDMLIAIVQINEHVQKGKKDTIGRR